MSWAFSSNRFHSPKRWMPSRFTDKKQLHRVEETLLWVTQLVGGPSQDLEQKAVRPAGAHHLNLLRPQLPKCRPFTIPVQGRGPDEKGSAKDPHHRPVSETEKASPTKRGMGWSRNNVSTVQRRGEKSDPRIKKAKWQKRTRVTRGPRPAGTCTAEAPAPARGRRRPEPQGSDKSPGRIAPAPPPRRPPTRPESPIADAWDVPEGSTRPPSPAGPPSAAPDPDRAPRRGAPPKPTPGGRAPGLGSRAAALPCKRNTRERRVNQRPQGAGEGAGRGPYLMAAGLCCGSGRCRSLRAFSSPSAPLRLSGGARAWAWARGRAGEVTAARGPRTGAAVFVKGRERERETRK